MSSRWRHSARFRHTVWLCVVIVAIMGAGAGWLIYQTAHMIHQAAEERGVALARAFAVTGATAVLGNLFVIQESIQKSFRDPAVLQIDVIDRDNMIIASKDVKRIGTLLGREDWLGRVRPSEEVVAYHEDAEGRPVLVVMEPLFAKRQLTAWLRVVVSLAQAQQEIWHAIGQVLLVTVALIAAGIIGVHLVQRHVSSVLHVLIGQLHGALSALGVSPSTPGSEKARGAPAPVAGPAGRGELEHLTDVATQATELVRTQSEALRESELKFRSVTQSASDAIVSADAEGRIISWNRGAGAIFGYQDDEVIGKPVTILMPDQYRELCDSGQRRLRAAEKPHLIGSTRELQGLRKDGTTFPLELSLSAWEATGQRYFTAIIRDVTERKRAEEAQRRLGAILEATPDLVGIADRAGHVLYLNRAGRGMIGIDEAEDLSQTTIAQYHPEPVATRIMEEGLSHAVRHGAWAAEAALLTRDGREIPVSQVILAHKAPGGAVEFYSTVARDITERKRAEREREALTVSLEQKVQERTAELQAARDQAVVATRHKSEFLASMSHELRTPLNAVIGFSEVLLERMFGDLNDKQEEYLQDIYSSGRHLLALINDILDLSKIEAGRIELEVTAFHLPSTIESAIGFVRERAVRHGITLTTDIDARLGECQGDERKIKQVLLNLLSNAIKFTPDGGAVRVTAKPAGGAAEIAVSDTGVGIPPEDHQRVFEEFYRAKGDQADKREGTGLGLSLAKKFVELHGGSISVASSVGKGSTFTFTIPLAATLAQASAHTPTGSGYRGTDEPHGRG